MTLLDDPPVVTEPRAARSTTLAGEPAAWRFAARLARRETRRRPGRTLLASLLIAVPVMAMTIGSVLARTESDDWAAQFDRRYGDSDIAVDPSVFGFAIDGEAPVVDLPIGTTTTEYLWTATQITTGDVDASFTYVRLTDIDLSDAVNGSPIDVVEGTPPQDGEILLPQELATALEVSIGDDLSFERPSGTWTVSGYGRIRDTYDAAIVIPGFDPDRIAPVDDQRVTLYRTPSDVSAAETQELAGRLGGVTRLVDPFSGDGDVTRGMAWGWVAGVLALVAVGIIVAAAFATSARRQLVTIGQLTANGATVAVVRRTLALQGTWTGLLGSIMGIVAGLVAVPVFAPWFERFILQHDIASLRISVVDLLVIALTATVAGTIAASVPARSASRIPVMAALAGRRPLGTLLTWLVPTGLLLLTGGLGFVAVAALGVNGSGSNNDDVWALMMILGVLGVVFGMCCATPLVIERIGRLGGQTSLSWRLALRSLARSRTRSSAVVAAIAVAVGGSIAAGAIVETAIRENANSSLPTLPDDTVVVNSYRYQEFEEDVDADKIVDLDALSDAPLGSELRGRIDTILPGATITPIRVATIDPAPFDPGSGDGVWPEPHGPLIADPTLVDTLGLSDADIVLLEASGTLQPMSRWELQESDELRDRPLAYQYRDVDGMIEFDATRGSTPSRYESAYGVYVTEGFARSLGFDIVERGAVIESPQALTVAQRDQLLILQSDLQGEQLDAFIEPGDAPRGTATEPSGGTENWSITYDEPRWRASDGDVWIARLVILAAVVTISLLVVAIGLSLAAAEGRDERNVLAVVGATPASMRRQASARAVVLAMGGIALGIPTGFLPAWVLYSVLNADSAISSEPLRFPWLIAGALLIAVPLLVAAVAWTGAGVGGRLRPPTPTRHD